VGSQILVELKHLLLPLPSQTPNHEGAKMALVLAKLFLEKRESMEVTFTLIDTKTRMPTLAWSWWAY
jgi:hypothetical protein